MIGVSPIWYRQTKEVRNNPENFGNDESFCRLVKVEKNKNVKREGVKQWKTD
jgi:hypothetical protein